MTKARNFVFTINNYVDEDMDRIRGIGGDEGCKYLCFGIEVGESGTPHLQGYVEFKNPRAFTAVCKLLKGHVELRKGTAKQASDYCKKDGKFEEFGVMSNPNGKRKDYDAIKEGVIEGKGIKDMLLDGVIGDTFTLSFAERISKYLEPSRDWECKIIWLYGETGTGKSKWAKEYVKEKSYWKANRSDKWWDGYDGQDIVWIDDLRGDWCKFHDMLTYADMYEVKVEVKGGYRQLRCNEIIVTCPYRPEDVWKNQEDMKQLIRRIKSILYFTKDGTVEQAARVIIEPSAVDKEMLQ